MKTFQAQLICCLTHRYWKNSSNRIAAAYFYGTPAGRTVFSNTPVTDHLESRFRLPLRPVTGNFHEIWCPTYSIFLHHKIRAMCFPKMYDFCFRLLRRVFCLCVVKCSCRFSHRVTSDFQLLENFFYP